MTLIVEIKAPTIAELGGTWANADKVIAVEMKAGMVRSTALVERDAKRTVAVDTKDLRRSITSKVEQRALVTTGTVGTNKPYGKAIEFSRLPGMKMPPKGALLDWMRRHGIQPDPEVAHRPSALAGLEYLIRRKIAQSGTTAQPFLIPALKDNLPRIRRELGPEVIKRAMPQLQAGRR